MKRYRYSLPYRLIACFVTIIFTLGVFLPPNLVSAQSLLDLPAPGSMVSLSPAFNPPIVRGITLYLDNPLKFDFIIDSGDENLQGEALQEETKKLIKYFMASLTVPADEMWVNLSPYEENRIIANGLSRTALGRDLLAQDYILKQLAASLIYPEDEIGKAFWDKVYAKAQKVYGTTEIPFNTFNKVWIVPEEASVYVNGTNVFVAKSHLKVLLEEDYVAMSHQRDIAESLAPERDLALANNSSNKRIGTDQLEQTEAEQFSNVSSSILREIIIPEIEKEVNEGKNFAKLRQIFNSMILATWYKQNLKESLLGQVYADQNKIEGITIGDTHIKEKIYNQYLAAFKSGVYDYIKEDFDETTQQPIPRKYFSGGILGVSKVSSSPITAGEVVEDRISQWSLHRARAFFGFAGSGKEDDKKIRILKDMHSVLERTDGKYKDMYSVIEGTDGNYIDKWFRLRAIIENKETPRGRFLVESYNNIYNAGNPVQRRILKIFLRKILLTSASMNKTLHIFEHSLDVALFVAYVGRILGLKEKSIENLVTAGLMHDIGKMRTLKSLNILSSKLPFSKIGFDNVEYAKRHEEPAFDILEENGVFVSGGVPSRIYIEEGTPGALFISRSVYNLVLDSNVDKINERNVSLETAILFLADQWSARLDLHRHYIITKMRERGLLDSDLTSLELMKIRYHDIKNDPNFKIQGKLAIPYVALGTLIFENDPIIYALATRTHFILEEVIKREMRRKNKIGVVLSASSPIRKTKEKSLHPSDRRKYDELAKAIGESLPANDLGITRATANMLEISDEANKKKILENFLNFRKMIAQNIIRKEIFAKSLNTAYSLGTIEGRIIKIFFNEMFSSNFPQEDMFHIFEHSIFAYRASGYIYRVAGSKYLTQDLMNFQGIKILDIAAFLHDIGKLWDPGPHNSPSYIGEMSQEARRHTEEDHEKDAFKIMEANKLILSEDELSNVKKIVSNASKLGIIEVKKGELTILEAILFLVDQMLARLDFHRRYVIRRTNDDGLFKSGVTSEFLMLTRLEYIRKEFSQQFEDQPTLRNLSNDIESMIRRRDPVIHELFSHTHYYLDTLSQHGGKDNLDKLLEIMSIPRKSSAIQSSPIGAQSKEDIGGIDLDSRNLDLQVQGNRIEMDFPSTYSTIDNMSVEGFLLFIIDITPITNIPLLLGIVEEEEEEQQLSGLSYNFN